MTQDQAQEKIKALESALEHLYSDGHQWGRRPCATCQKIVDLVGFDFGCIRYAREET